MEKKKKKKGPPIQEAVYCKLSDPAFRGNPLVEALPIANMTSTAMQKQAALARAPEDPRPAPSESRNDRALWLLKAAAGLFVAVGRHVVLFEWIDRIIRVGYLYRNPLGTRNAEYLAEAYKRQQNGENLLVRYGEDHLGPLTLSLVGCSGTGKSLAVQAVLKYYPQVIHHSCKQMDNFYQVVYLKITCPPNGSLKGLCKDIVGEIDRVTGLDYKTLYRIDRATESDLKKAVAQVMALHRVGLLVIDEIQNLASSNKNRDELFNFIVSLADSLEVPILNVGTPKVRFFIDQDMKTARRFGILGKYEWGSLKFSQSEWSSFMAELGKLYVLKEPITDAHIEYCLYYYSQGIPAILVNLFLLSQIMAMVERKEKLTCDVITKTDGLFFSHLHAMMSALRSRNRDELAKYPDLTFTHTDHNLAGAKLITSIWIDDIRAKKAALKKSALVGK